MADDSLGIKKEGTFLSPGNLGSNAASFDWPAVKVKVEIEPTSEDGGETRETDLYPPPAFNQEEKIAGLGGCSIMADKCLNMKVEDPLLPTDTCMSSAAPVEWPLVIVKVENEIVSEDKSGTNDSGSGMKSIKAEKADSLPLDVTVSAKNVSPGTSSSQFLFVDTSTIKQEEDSMLQSDMPSVKVKVENELLLEQDFGTSESETGMTEMKKEEAAVSSDDGTSLGESRSFGISNGQSIDTNVLMKEENLGVCFEGEDGATLVSADSCVSFKDGDNSCHDVEVFVKTEVIQEVDKFDETESCSFESVVDSERVDTASQKKSSLQSKASLSFKEKRFACMDCSATFKRKQTLAQHALAHSGERPFACTQCSAKFKRLTNLNAHLVTHSSDRPFACSHCTWRFRDKGALNKHLRTHSGQKLVSCAHCAAKFSSNSSMKAHVAALHLKANSYSCTQCSVTFAHEKNLKRHLGTHTNEKPFLCPHCAARFVRKASLNLHLNAHSNIKPVSCPQCQAKFTQRIHMRAHLATVHSDVKAFSCMHCPAKFALKGNLKRHLVLHTTNELFSCPHCPAKFSRKSQVTRHVAHSSCKSTPESYSRSHAATHFDGPFSCSHCISKFSTKRSLNAHLLVHSSLKPFLCAHCSGAFKTKWKLRQHIVVHTNDK